MIGLLRTLVRLLKQSSVSIAIRVDGSALLRQRRFWEHTIKDDGGDLKHCVDYCYINPVKHGLVTAVVD